MGIKGIIKSLEVSQVDREEALDNPDLRPTPVAERQWGTIAYGLYWMGAISQMGAWSGTPLTSGLGVWSAVFASLGGMILAGIFLALCGRAGAVYRVPFPVIARSCFGVYGVYWPMIARSLVTFCFHSIGVLGSAQILTVMITCITPHYKNIPNHMGPNSILTSADMLSFFLFWLILCAFCTVPLPKWRFLVYGKIAMYWIAAFGMLGWVLHRTGGAKPILEYPSSVTGSEYAWTMIQFIFLFLNQSTAYISGGSDFSKLATKPRDPILGHLITFPIANLVNSIMGLIILGSSVPLFGEPQWNAALFMQQFLEINYTPAGRAAMFFFCLAMLLASVVTNALENNLPGAMDVMGLFPRFINLRRAFFIVLISAWIMQPWYLMGSASIYVSFIFGFSTWLSSLIGILLAQYYVISRGYIDMSRMYDARPDGPYYYWRGVNWRAYAAYVLGVVPNFWGFLGELGLPVSKMTNEVEYFSCIMGISVSFLSFWAFTYLFPPAGTENHLNLKGWKEATICIDPSDPYFLDASTENEDLKGHTDVGVTHPEKV